MSAARRSAGIAATSSTVAWPSSAWSLRPISATALSQPAPSADLQLGEVRQQGRYGNLHGDRAVVVFGDLGAVAHPVGQRLARGVLRVVPDQGRTRPGPRGHARRPKSLAG